MLKGLIWQRWSSVVVQEFTCEVNLWNVKDIMIRFCEVKWGDTFQCVDILHFWRGFIACFDYPFILSIMLYNAIACMLEFLRIKLNINIDKTGSLLISCFKWVKSSVDSSYKLVIWEISAQWLIHVAICCIWKINCFLSFFECILPLFLLITIFLY